MNTFSYLSNLFSPSPRSQPTVDEQDSPPPTPSTSSSPPSTSPNTPTTIDTDTESTGGDTLYLSARRGTRPGERPRVTLSLSSPVHLGGGGTQYERVVFPRGEGDVRPEMMPLPDSPVLGNDDDEEEEDEEGSYRREDEEKRSSKEGEYEEGERRLKVLREEQARERDRLVMASRAWPVRLSVGLYVFLRRFLSLFGFPPSAFPALASATPSLPILTPPLPTNDPMPSEDKDELYTALSPSSTSSTATPPLPPPSSTRSSTFFLRRTPTPTGPPPSSRSPSPVPPTLVTPAHHPRPPRLTPKTLVLDLDETLIHSTSRPYANSGRGAGLKVRVVEVVLEGRSTVYTVYKRPWVDFFLRKVSAWYTVIIFTASLPEYADPVIDWLDGGDGGGGMVGGRLFRSDCRHSNGSYVKDLSVVDADLSRVCLVDNSPASYAINQANGIPIEGWINDPNDECLLDLLPMLDSLRFTSDVRRVLGLRGFGK